MDRQVVIELEDMFKHASLNDNWPGIDEAYRSYFKFSDNLADDQRIDEYTWIAQQYKKFVNKEQAPIMGFRDDWESRLKYVKGLADKEYKPSTDRKHMVYGLMRDAWIAEMQSYVEMKMEDIANEKMAESEDW
jgi:hypothetical protein